MRKKKTPEELAAYRKAWAKANPEKMRAASRRSYAKHRTKNIARSLAWMAANPDKTKARLTTYRQENPERIKLTHSCWRKNNLARRAEAERRYRASKSRACPPWAKGCPQVAAIYDIAEWLRSVGDNVHVDHIFPLKPEGLDCPQGLHVYENLRILPASENHRKKNKQPTLAEIEARRGW